MLVLQRGVDEKVRIGPAVTVTVLQIKSGKVRLGFEAPPELGIHRDEVFQAIAAEHQRVAGNPERLVQDIGSAARQDRETD